MTSRSCSPDFFFVVFFFGPMTAPNMSGMDCCWRRCGWRSPGTAWNVVTCRPVSPLVNGCFTYSTSRQNVGAGQRQRKCHRALRWRWRNRRRPVSMSPWGRETPPPRRGVDGGAPQFRSWRPGARQITARDAKSNP